MRSIHRQPAVLFFSECSRQPYLLLAGLGLLSLLVAAASADEKSTLMIGYTEGRNDLEGGQFVNWVTNRACLVGADGYSASPDGKRISYHENYQVYIADVDGGDKRKVETKNPFNFAPGWSPDGEWLLFVSGEHYNCHPHIVKKDGTGLKKLADRGGYRGGVEVLKHPDFHSESSDVPVWSAEGRHVFYTAKVGDSIELMRVDLDGNVTQLTKSKPGTRHYHRPSRRTASGCCSGLIAAARCSSTSPAPMGRTAGRSRTSLPVRARCTGTGTPVVTKPGGLGG